MKKHFTATLVAILAAARTAQASPEDIFSYGGRLPAMGGAGIATADSADAAYANPALLSGMRARKLTLGFVGAAFALSADGSTYRGRARAPSAKGTVIAADIPLPFGGVLKDRVAIGLAFFTPTDVVVRGRILYPETPQFPLLPDRAESVTLRGGAGFDVGHGIQVGVGFAALAQIQGRVTIASDATGRVGSQVDNQLIATYSPTIGAAYTKDMGTDRKLRVGATFRGTLDARFAIDVDARKLSNLNIPPFNIAGLAQYDPAQLGVEGAYFFGPNLVTAGITWKRWSGYPGLLEPTVLCQDGGNDCGVLNPVKLSFSDTFVVRGGTEWQAWSDGDRNIKLRGGLLFEPSPMGSNVPASQAYSLALARNAKVPTRYFDADRIALSFGAGVQIGAFQLDWWGQYHALIPRTVSTEDESGPLSAEVSGRVLASGLTVGAKF